VGVREGPLTPVGLRSTRDPSGINDLAIKLPMEAIHMSPVAVKRFRQPTFLLIILSLGLHLAHSQQPQTQAIPITGVNAQYANGVAPGYWPTAGSGLTLNLSGGTTSCNGSIIQYTAGTLTLTASATNNVYLDTTSSCVPAVKTSSFTANDIPIATVVTSGSAIISITDNRSPLMYKPSISSTPTASPADGQPTSTQLNRTGDANALELNPGASQTINLPVLGAHTGGRFGIASSSTGGASSYVFSDPISYAPGNVSPGSVFTENIQSNPNSLGYYAQNTHSFTCAYQGQYLTSYWAGCYQNKEIFLVNTSSIAQRESTVVDFAKVGDAMDQYIYMNGYGKSPEGDDEGIGAIHYQMAQYGVISGTVSSVTKGANSTQAITFTGKATCASVGFGSCTNPSDGYLFSQGALAYNASHLVATFIPARVTGTLFSGGINSGNNNSGIGILINTTATPFTASTAWGSFEASTCTGGLASGYAYQLVTCTVVLGISPASPGNFVAGQSATISAQFEETVTLTSVTPPSGGLQKISFYTVKSWNIGPRNGVVMQGGNSGDMMVQNGFGWKIVGATSTSQAVVSNCFLAWCQTNNPASNLPGTSSVSIYHGAEVSGTSGGSFNKVQLTTSNFTTVSGDVISQAISTSWFGNMMELDAYKATPETYSPNALLQLTDLGAAHYSYGLIVQNQGGIPTTTPATGGLYFEGSYRTAIKSLLRPWASSSKSLGSIIEETGDNPSGTANDSYNLLKDDGGGVLTVTPGGGTANNLGWSGSLQAFTMSVGTIKPVGAFIASPRFTFSPSIASTQPEIYRLIQRRQGMLLPRLKLGL
jgi:hypothetical protein